MRALIYRARRGSLHGRPRWPRMPGRIPVAGRPLLIRQLQWLRSYGIREVAVELARSSSGRALKKLLDDDVMGRGAAVVWSGQPLGPWGVAEELGGAEPPLVAVPDDVIGDCDIHKIIAAAERYPGGCELTLPSNPRFVGQLKHATVSVLSDGEAERQTRRELGWAVRIESFEDSLVLGRAILLGEVFAGPGAATDGDVPGCDVTRHWQLPIHAARRDRGVWVARGGIIEAKADIEPPVLVGAGAIVCRGARIGPEAFLGPRSVVSPGAEVRRSFIEADTIIRVGAKLDSVVVTPHRVFDLRGVFLARASVYAQLRRTPFAHLNSLWRRLRRALPGRGG